MTDFSMLHTLSTGPDTPVIASAQWRDVYACLNLMKEGLIHRLGLHGQTRTGKTTSGRWLSEVLGMKFYKQTFTPETPMAEARGHYVPSADENGNAYLRWMDGPCISAWRHGGLLLIDEIDRGGSDLQSFAYALFDDPDVAALTLPKQVQVLQPDGTYEMDCETVRPHKDFKCIVTTNRSPDELEEAVRDRFPIWLTVDEPNPQMYSRLPEWTRMLAWQSGAMTDERRINPQKWVDFGKACVKVDALTLTPGEERAKKRVVFNLIFGDSKKDIFDMMHAANPAKMVGMLNDANGNDVAHEQEEREKRERIEVEAYEMHADWLQKEAARVALEEAKALVAQLEAPPAPEPKPEPEPYIGTQESGDYEGEPCDGDSPACSDSECTVCHGDV